MRRQEKPVEWRVFRYHLSGYPSEISRLRQFPCFPWRRGKKVVTGLLLGLLVLAAVTFSCGSLLEFDIIIKNALGSWARSKGELVVQHWFASNNSRCCSAASHPPTGTRRRSLPLPPADGVINYAGVAPSYCPEYFRWIHEDLRPWRNNNSNKGITREMVERARTTANFRLLVVKGKLYVEPYSKAIQTRDIYTWWGFLQLLRKYRGQIPDLDLMFDCEDRPVIKATDFFPNKRELPPPLFRYCKDGDTLDILFPDWSFWGWSEINIKPWVPLIKDMKKGNKRKRWIDREPYAYWRGNPTVSPVREDLLKCNLSVGHDWNARLFAQDWLNENRQGFKHSNLADQCAYRYKIYVEGWAWSVSYKYILACDSPTLMVASEYFEFFTRALEPLQHYWPINKETKCKSIKFAVDWGNTNTDKAQDIGRKASNFIVEELKMDYVYDYMFHLLNEYAKLLRYVPKVPPNARELRIDSMLGAANGMNKKFMIDSMVDISQVPTPCSLPPPYDPEEVEVISKRRQEALNLVQSWEENYLSSTVES